MTGPFLGGVLAPLGLSVSFLRHPIAEVRGALLTWRKLELRQVVEESGPLPFPACASLLDPLEAPWAAEVLIASRDWTVYLNNDIDGGDPTAAAPYLSKRVGCDCVVAMHAPPYGPGHASTQLWMMGPGGKPPLMYIRTIAAYAEDGHWSWRTDGQLQLFERPERYTARRVRDRFDRGLLVDYLATIGIRVDDLGFYGEGFGVRQIVSFPRRQELRRRFARASSGEAEPSAPARRPGEPAQNQVPRRTRTLMLCHHHAPADRHSRSRCAARGPRGARDVSSRPGGATFAPPRTDPARLARAAASATVEPGRTRARIERTGCVAVVVGVAEHVRQRVADLARRAQRTRVVALGEHPSGASEVTVDEPRRANGEAMDSTRERLLVRTFDH